MEHHAIATKRNIISLFRIPAEGVVTRVEISGNQARRSDNLGAQGTIRLQELHSNRSCFVTLR